MSNKTSQLSLYIPHLLNPGPKLEQLNQIQFPKLTHLSHILSRAKTQNYLKQNFFERCFSFFNQLPDTEYLANHDLPIGPLSLHSISQQTQQFDSSWVYQISPVYLHPDMDQLVLSEDLSQDIENHEGESICRAINEYFNQSEIDRSWHLEYFAEERFYLISDREIKISTTILAEVLGKPITQYLIKGEDAAYWNQTLNEIQMFLFAMPLYHERQDNGKTPVNSLWIWGGGQYPYNADTSQPRSITESSNLLHLAWNKIYANSMLLQDFANYLQIDYAPAKHFLQDYGHCIHKNQGPQLLVIDELKSAHDKNDFYAWLDNLEKLEKTLFPTIIQLLKEQQFGQVNILTERAEIYQINKFQLNAWWKRIHSFNNFLA